MERKKKMEKRNGKALLPIFVFVVLYLGLGILFEYGLRIEMGFYKIPVVVIFLIALLVACLQNRACSSMISLPLWAPASATRILSR